MGILGPIFAAILNLAVVIIDVSVILIIVRFLRRLWPSSMLLAAVDTAGAPIVGSLTDMAGRAWSRLETRRDLSENGKLAVTLLFLYVVRTLLGVGWTLLR